VSLSRASGVDFLEKALFVDALAEEVRFMLWDTGERNAERLCDSLLRAPPLTNSSLPFLQLDKKNSMRSRGLITEELVLQS